MTNAVAPFVKKFEYTERFEFQTQPAKKKKSTHSVKKKLQCHSSVYDPPYKHAFGIYSFI